MNLDSQCAVLSKLWLYYRDTADEAWTEFFIWADVGLPLAHTQVEGYATLTDEGRALVQETWMVFCEMIGIDPSVTYETLEDALAASPNPPLTKRSRRPHRRPRP